jgi:hypothetical protein
MSAIRRPNSSRTVSGRGRPHVGADHRLTSSTACALSKHSIALRQIEPAPRRRMLAA